MTSDPTHPVREIGLISSALSEMKACDEVVRWMGVRSVVSQSEAHPEKTRIAEISQVLAMTGYCACIALAVVCLISLDNPALFSLAPWLAVAASLILLASIYFGGRGAVLGGGGVGSADLTLYALTDKRVYEFPEGGRPSRFYLKALVAIEEDEGIILHDDVGMLRIQRLPDEISFLALLSVHEAVVESVRSQARRVLDRRRGTTPSVAASAVPALAEKAVRVSAQSPSN